MNGNLFDDGESPARGERFDKLLEHRGLVVERIVSSSRIVPQEYVQEQDEWVVLLQGKAELELAGERRSLAAGDYVFIPAHTPHSVLRVSDGALWLAVHLYPTTDPQDCSS